MKMVNILVPIINTFILTLYHKINPNYTWVTYKIAIYKIEKEYFLYKLGVGQYERKTDKKMK